MARSLLRVALIVTVARIAFTANLPSRSSRIFAYIDDQPAHILACRILLFDVMTLNDDEGIFDQRPKEFRMCNPIQDGEISSKRYSIELPPSIEEDHWSFVMAAGSARSSPWANSYSSSSLSTSSLEDYYIGIPYGYIDSMSMKIVIPDPLTVYVLDVNPHRHGHRHLERASVTTKGTYRALVLRIIDSNGRAPSHSVQQLAASVFDPNDISAHSQYRNCSWGQFTIIPPAGDGTGVMELTVDMDTSIDEDYRKISQKAEAVALDVLGIDNLYDYTDFLLYVTPPMGSWIAYASVGGGYSVYNSSWGGYISSIIHEIGHNLGLLHANKGLLGSDEARYQDFSGYMSASRSSYMQEKYPLQCFNGANHWQLKWYEDSGHAYELDPETPEILHIGAFADRNKFHRAENSQEFAVVKSGDCYVQYNGAWGINRDTYLAKNHLTVTHQWDDGTYLVGEIVNVPGTTWTLTDTDWTIKICEFTEGSTTEAEVLTVWIGNGTPDCSGSGASDPTPDYGNCKSHLETCTANNDCCSKNCRPTGTGLLCVPNPNAQQQKNELRISHNQQLLRRRTSAIRGSTLH